MIPLSTLSLSESSPDSDREPREHKYEVNTYFVDNPSHVLGVWTEVIGKRGRALAVRWEGAEALKGVCAALDAYVSDRATPLAVLATPSAPAAEPAETEPERAALAIYSATKALLAAPSNEARELALSTYYSFTERWGSLRGAFNVKHGGVLANTPLAKQREAAFLLSLETPQGKPSALLTGFITPKRTVTGNCTLADALLICLDEKGVIDIERISALTGLSGTPPEETESRLLAEGLAFRAPPGCISAQYTASTVQGTRNLIPSTDYLTGDVGAKLRTATAAGVEYARNVEALTAALPEPLSPEEISVGLGAGWVPAEVFTDWAYTLFPGETWGLRIQRTPSSTWVIECSNPQLNSADSAIRTKRVSGIDLISAALNNQMPVVTDEIKGPDGWPVKIRNEAETMEACARVAELRSKFDSWVWSTQGKSGETGESRTARLTTIYNERFNGHAQRDLSGDYLTFDGLAAMVGGRRYELKSRQRRGVAKILTGGTRDKSAYLVYPPGFGKTDPAICAAVKLRQLGLAQRTLFVVPKTSASQWYARFLALFPGYADEVLCSVDPIWGAGSGALARDVFLNRIATGGWPYVIITHEMLREILLSRESYDALLREELAELRAALRESESGASGVSKDSTRQAKRGLRERESALERARVSHLTKWERLCEGGRVGISWEDCAVDHIVVDECFPYQTKVLTNKGLIAIGQLQSYLPAKALGRATDGSYSWTEIVRVFVKPSIKPIARIAHQYGVIYATIDHKIHTPTGYVKAGCLSVGDTLYAHVPSLRTLQKDFQFLRHTTRNSNSTILQSLLRGSLAYGATWLQNVNVSARQAEPKERYQVYQTINQKVPGKNLFDLWSTIQVLCDTSRSSTSPFLWNQLLSQMAYESAGNEGGCFSRQEREAQPVTWNKKSRDVRIYETQQSYAKSCYRGQSFGFSERSDFFSPRRQRSINSASDSTCNSPQSSNGSCHHTSNSETSISMSAKPFQGRYRRRITQISNRSRWTQPQDQEMALFGSAQGIDIVCARVDSVEILEPGSFELTTVSAGTGCVYDIEVETNHNYFADGILVSNCHAMKALGVSTRMERVAGLPQRESARAYDAWTKFQTVLRAGGRVTCLSGTPLTNTLAEAFVWMKMLQPNLLRHLQLQNFDAWASVFAEAYGSIEMDCTGRFRSQTRLRFRNVPELLAMLGETWDFVREDA